PTVPSPLSLHDALPILTVVTEFDHDPAAAHLLRDRSRRSRTGERVQDPLAGLGRDVDDALEEPLRLRRGERLNVGQQLAQVIPPDRKSTRLNSSHVKIS